MAISSTNIVSTDIYDAVNLIDNIKSKYIDIPEDTLMLGVFGYLSEVHSNLLENATIMASEYSMEAIPTQAKFERNIIAHALALGIEKINANPAVINVILGIPEDALINNMTDDKFTLDKEFAFNLGAKEQYEYHLDYDVIITRSKLPNGNYAYTAMYDIDGTNSLVTNTNPYLPTMGEITYSNTNLITLNVSLRQFIHTEVYKKILSDNPLLNQSLTFTFTNQLAFFYVEAVENGVTKILTPVYDGLYDYSSDDGFINYLYLDASTIRLKFNQDSYMPSQNADITIHIYTTNGSSCNFTYDDTSDSTTDIKTVGAIDNTTNGYVRPLSSDRFSYNNIYIWMKPTSDSSGGTDKATISELQKDIPQEELSRGTVTTYTDLNNYFNSIQTDYMKLIFLEKVHNQIDRLFYCYMLMKDTTTSNVIPTNTITTNLTRDSFSNISASLFVISPGSVYFYNTSTGDTESIPVSQQTADNLALLDKTGFLYFNPFLTVINKSPFYVSYYNMLINYSRVLYFNWINSNSTLQFISTSLSIKRQFFTNPDIYTINLSLLQNINSDFQMVVLNKDGSINQTNIDVYAIVYITQLDGTVIPYRYLKANITSYDSKNFAYYFSFQFSTNDQINSDTTLNIITGTYGIGSSIQTQSSFPTNISMKLFFLGKFDAEYGRTYTIDTTNYNLDDYIPNLSGYTLTNVYEVSNGLDIFYDYSDIQNSYIELNKDSVSGDFIYTIYKMPVIRYTYLNETRLSTILKTIEKNRIWIQSAIVLLEDSFGIDIKFFNTYGPSKTYDIDTGNLLDKINLSLKFEIKLVNSNETSILSSINSSIKEYLEDLNSITDFYMSNLITYITNTYRDQIVYFKPLGINDYPSLMQTITKSSDMTNNSFLDSQTVPEYINVNTLQDDSPDITYSIKS